MAEGVAHYHLISRTCNRQFLLRKAKTKDMLLDLLRRAAEFSGIDVEACVAMDNHVHVLCTVSRTGTKVPADEVVRRVRALKGDRAADALSERLSELEAAGFVATMEAELDRYRSRMNDISEFMKTAKELFAIWFNREFGYSGSVWGGAYKSTMVEGGEYLARCRRYILLNPVRAGIVGQVGEYRWVWAKGAPKTEVFAGCLPAGERALLVRAVQLGEGKVYGSEGFVRRWLVGLGELFWSRSACAHAVGGLGFSSHGWKIAKREAERVAACG